MVVEGRGEEDRGGESGDWWSGGVGEGGEYTTGKGEVGEEGASMKGKGG